MIKNVIALIIGFFLAILISGIILQIINIPPRSVIHKRNFTSVPLEKHHTQYDEEIGWINIPNIYIEDLYGPGKYLKTNVQMSRNNNNFSARIPGDKARIICSGDSYTLGYGVSNENTWCQQLTTINNQIEAVNLGQGGYGIDQAYLWYKRNMTKLDHDIHIFAFITADFKRMHEDDFLGYGKPYLELHNGVLVNKIKSIPKARKLDNKQTDYAQLNLVNLIRKQLSIIISAYQFSEIQKIALKIFENLYTFSKNKNTIQVLVYLPTNYDHGGTFSDHLRNILKEEATRNGWIFIDLIKEIRKYPLDKIETLYDGHLNEQGNSFIADILYKELINIPEIADKLIKK